MSAHARAAARRDQASAEWFDALGAGRLLLRACTEGHLSRPDVLACDVCGATELTWREARGGGSIVSLAVDHSTSPATQLAVVELTEGPWLLTRVEGGQVERGAGVVIEVCRPTEGEPYPVASVQDRR
jgi:uncharacterized OB-fold protein